MNYSPIQVTELKEKLDTDKKPFLLDVREPFELDIAAIPDVVNIPMNQVPHRLDEINADEEIVVICRSGKRSAKICEFLLSKDYKVVKNLEGGIRAWSMEIDPSVPLY